jgi:hypothetical protein
LLPHVYLTNTGEPTRRQLLVGALLYTGPAAAIDGPDACWFYGVKAVPLDRDHVHVLVPRGSAARSVGYVRIRQSTTPFTTEATELVRYVAPATAVISATRQMRRPRSVLAALSDAVQRGIVDYEDLLVAHRCGPPRNSRLATEALVDIGAGIRSAAEADVRRLAQRSRILAGISFNVWIRLRCGRVVCLDALLQSSAVVHEVNGRTAHAREDLFEDMQDRHDSLTASGFVALHSSPRRIRRTGPLVLRQLEETHQLYDGRGMPKGVDILTVADIRGSMPGYPPSRRR